MFQSFDAPTRPEDGPPRLAALRAHLAAKGLDGFLIPRADAWQGEYVSPHDERLSWLTGFTGSAGFCIVLPNVAGVFIDGRYRVQVNAQVDPAAFTPVNWPETRAADWLRRQLTADATIGFDPWLHTPKEIKELEAGLKGTAIRLVPVANAVDAVWADQPAPACGKIASQPLEFAGESAEDKLARIAAVLREAGQEAAVLTAPDSISWLLNIRGSDVPKNPVVQAFAILSSRGKLDLFIDPAKLGGVTLPATVRTHRPDSLRAALQGLTGPVRIDPATVPVWVVQELQEAGRLQGDGIPVANAEDPCLLPKARKNAAEIAATTEAHLRDGAAMVEFLAWLDAEAPKGHLTEIAVVTALEGFRRATNALRDISFDTICGAGPNGAIVHYRVTTGTDRPVRPGELLLVDSGGQYVDGTTDITRTVAVGEVGTLERDCFTRVLQGMIAISRLRWPAGRAGRDLEAVARYPQWLAGMDYDHGTGHGVGAYLSVHEGPARLSRLSEVPLEPGMILSNEPGYYREGAFGIRIENLVVVEEAPALQGADDRAMLAFRTLTWVPIDRRLIVAERLAPGERDWLNAYHAEVAERIAPRVTEPARAWLMAATAPI
ncbi:M24 family metallopeptidase [Frigidibacter albus]|uniref:M24 family metallopeptidase n=1 Tax=Frigidibacter albus TaxID=1465486 RepID=A0A6L8VGZ1_9RHOB|nr:aminopeptidase P family protein [Frigidibacter albus]MZQ88991.1 M24 family metallopeptidase [Frigidibacter albus]NBE30952.1 M24 family metallopeptidase [Frigidibacter albus]GGH52049.1 Xaa-Pro aminopeptidase [Frigidibacter albus]